MMQVLVVTGGIGSGKSEVCRILKEKGIDCQYDADRMVKRLYGEHPTLLADIERELGSSFRNDDGVFVPGKLASRIFSDSDALETVESLVFPALIDDFRSFCHQNADEDILVFESATILEKPFFDGFGDSIVLVDAPLEMRLERACRRDGVSRDAVAARMKGQKLMNALSEGYADPRIDAVIMNDSGIGELENRIENVMTVLFGDWKK